MNKFVCDTGFLPEKTETKNPKKERREKAAKSKSNYGYFI